MGDIGKQMRPTVVLPKQRPHPSKLKDGNSCCRLSIRNIRGACRRRSAMSITTHPANVLTCCRCTFPSLCFCHMLCEGKRRMSGLELMKTNFVGVPDYFAEAGTRVLLRASRPGSSTVYSLVLRLGKLTSASAARPIAFRVETTSKACDHKKMARSEGQVSTCVW